LFVVTIGAAGFTDTADEALPAPAAFTAFNLMLYVVPFVRPEIVTGLEVSAGENAV
jgi:hypothetical protein